MKFLDAVNNKREIFKDLGFTLKESNDHGMHKVAKFTNGLYDVYFSYDRGGIEFIAQRNSGQSLDIIALVNWFHKDLNKYKFPEIGQYTDEVTINYYAEIFSREFILLNQFMLNATEKDIIAFNGNQAFEGAKYWSKVYSDKGLPIPDNLKEILERGESHLP
jgi:hypothetical protein